MAEAIKAGARYEALRTYDREHSRTWVAVERTGRGWRFKAEDGCTQIIGADNVKLVSQAAGVGDKVKITASAPQVYVTDSDVGLTATVIELVNNSSDYSVRVQMNEGTGNRWSLRPQDFELLSTEKKTLDAHQDDINKIFRALSQEAEDREWCYEYQTFLDALLPTLSVQPTEGVAKDWELDVFGTVVKVNALTEDAAKEKLIELLQGQSYNGVLETE